MQASILTDVCWKRLSNSCCLRPMVSRRVTVSLWCCTPSITISSSLVISKPSPAASHSSSFKSSNSSKHICEFSAFVCTKSSNDAPTSCGQQISSVSTRCALVRLCARNFDITIGLSLTRRPHPCMFECLQWMKRQEQRDTDLGCLQLIADVVVQVFLESLLQFFEKVIYLIERISFFYWLQLGSSWG